MQNNFSKCREWVPRGTSQHKWRWLTTLLLILTLGIGQMWGADPSLPTECLELPTTSTYMDGLQYNVSGYSHTYYLSASADTLILDHYVMNQSSVTNSKKIKWITYNGKGSSGADWSANFGFKGKDYYGNNTQASVHSGRTSWYRVKGASKFIALYNSAGSSKKCVVSAYEITYVGEDPVKASSASVTRTKQSSDADTIQLILDKSKEYIIETTGSSSSGFRMPEVMFIAPTCNDANASVIANTSVYVNDELDLQFSSDNVNSVSYSIKKNNETTTDASVTAGVFKATVAGTYVVTATQAKDASSHCAVEESVTITVNPKTPVSSVSISGDATAYVGMAKTLTATADQAVSEYKWEVDGVDQGVNAATFNFTAAAAGTYSVVCKARNSFNDPGEYIESSAHSMTVTSLYGGLINFTAKTGSSAIDQDLPAANIGGIVGGTVHQKSQSNAKLNTGHYYSLTLASGSFQAGDTVRIVVKPEGDKHSVPATLMLSSKQDNTAEIGSVTGLSAPNSDNITADIILTTSASTIYLSRDGTITSQNPIVVSMAVIRPMPVKFTAYDLTDVKINGTAISAAELATLKTADAYLVDLMAGYAAAPVVKFARQTTTTYEDDSQKVANDTITVTASEVSSKWQAQATIGTITYTVKAAKQSSAKVTYYDGGTKIGEETVAFNGHPAEYATYQTKQLASFVDWYNNADLAEEHKIADISELVVAKDTTVYGKWTYTYAQSVNVEKWVLDNGKTPNSDQTGALVSLFGTRGFASNLSYEEKKVELDSLNDGKGTGRNYAYLGLKVKYGGKMLDLRLANGQTVKVKFGATGNYPQVKINNVGSYADISLTNNVWTYTAEGADAYISIKTSNDNAVVFQQIMIGEDIQDVTLPEATRHAVALTKAGETEHGTLAVASPETYNWLAENTAVTLTVAADDGYYIESVTLNSVALTPSEDVYSFNMPNATANVVATFAEIVPNNVTYKANNGGADADILAENATEIAGCSFTYAGHKFNGWNTAPDGTGNAYAEGDPVLSPLTLYAQWREYFVITYKDGDDVLDTEDVFVGEAPVGIADPVKAMNIFQGWTLAGSDEVIDVTALTASTTVYAKWEAIDACFYFSAKSVDADEAITAPANLDNAFGGTLEATDGTFKYTTTGVLIEGGGSKYFTVNLNYALQEGSKITVKMYAGGTSERGLNLRVAGSSSNVYQYKWTPSATEPAQMEYEYEYVVPANSPLIGKKVFYLYRNNNVYLQTVMVKDCAPQDYTVTYKDGESVLGTEQVFENEHPTADGINTHKKGYEFQGWAETVDGAVVDLDDITITAAKNLFAQYTVKDCSPKGVKFSMAIDGSKISANQYYPATTPAVGDLAVFATVTGGVAQAVNTSTGTTKNLEVKTTPEFKLGGSNSHMRILLDCPLAENDTIKFDKSERIVLSFDSLKTKSENIAKSTSYYIVPAAYAGEDTIHIWYNNNGVSVNGVQVIRPEIYTVSFDLMGHGSAIAPVDVVKGAKIVAPTAPTDEDYAFAGWYKENTLSTAWDFDNDVVTANITLYAKWLDKSDATLKSLKYGETDIVLVDGIYVYNIDLPALTTAVPALTAVTKNQAANAEVTNATAFEDGHATSTVVVTPEKSGAATQTYTVNFTKAAVITLQDVNKSTTWDFANAVTAEVQGSTNVVTVLANYPGVTNDDTFESDKLEAKGGNLYAGSKPNMRAKYMHFRTTVPGRLTITYSNTGNNDPRFIYVNGIKYDEVGSDGTAKTGENVKFVVPAGDVELEMKEGNNAANVCIYKIVFDTNLVPDDTEEARLEGYERDVTEGNYGTICLPKAGVMVGASIYTLAYYGETSHKFFFDEVVNGTMEAGKPYLFLPNEGVNHIGVYYTDNQTESAKTVNGLVGYIGDDAEDFTQVPDNGNCYIIQNNLYRQVLNGGQAFIKSNRAYIDMTGATNIEPAKAPGARRIGIGAEAPQVTTGADNLNVGDQPVKLIIDGQMYILRGEKMYDATGRLLK